MPQSEKVETMRCKRDLRYILPLLLTLFLWTSCSDDQLFRGNTRIQTTFRLKSQTALGGSVTIKDAYLKLNSIGVSGTLGDQSVPPASYPVAPEEAPFRLTQSDSAQVSLTLPSRAYDLLDFHLLLVQSKYQLLTLQQPAEPAPEPVTDNGGNTDGGVTEDEGTPSGDDNGGQPDTGSDDSPADNGDGGQSDDDGSGGDDDKQNDDPSDDDGANAGGDTNTPPQEDDNDDQGGNNDEEKGEGNKNDDGKGDGGKDDDKDDKDDEEKDEDDKDDDKDSDDKDDDDDEKDDGRARSEVDGTVDLDHFFQNAKPSLVVFATWNVNGENINIVFAVTDAERITIRATQNGGQRVMLADHGTATVTFDPEDWFQSVSATDLQNASRQAYQGQSVVFIHHDHNTALFDLLYSSLIESTTLEFTVPSVE